MGANFLGPAEVDESSSVGATHSRRQQSQREGPVADLLPSTDRLTLHEFVTARTDESATVYTDDYAGYRNLPRKHESVNHHAGQMSVSRRTRTGSIWAMLKRGYKGTYHWMSEKHLNRYVAEFSGRHNSRPRLRRIVRAMHRRHLSWAP